MKAKTCLVIVCFALANCHAQIFQHTIGSFNFEFCWDITSSNDGNYMVLGNSSSFGSGSIYLLKITPDGDTVYTKTYGDQGEMGLHIRALGQNGYIIAGSTQGF